MFIKRILELLNYKHQNVNQRKVSSSIFQKKVYGVKVNMYNNHLEVRKITASSNNSHRKNENIAQRNIIENNIKLNENIILGSITDNYEYFEVR